MNISGSSSRGTPKLKKEISSGGIGGGIGSLSRKDTSAIAAISFYAEPPHYELSLDEFEEYAIARLKVRSFLIVIII